MCCMYFIYAYYVVRGISIYAPSSTLSLSGTRWPTQRDRLRLSVSLCFTIQCIRHLYTYTHRHTLRYVCIFLYTGTLFPTSFRRQRRRRLRMRRNRTAAAERAQQLKIIRFSAHLLTHTRTNQPTLCVVCCVPPSLPQQSVRQPASQLNRNRRD